MQYKVVKYPGYFDEIGVGEGRMDVLMIGCADVLIGEWTNLVMHVGRVTTPRNHGQISIQGAKQAGPDGPLGDYVADIVRKGGPYGANNNDNLPKINGPRRVTTPRDP